MASSSRHNYFAPLAAADLRELSSAEVLSYYQALLDHVDEVDAAIEAYVPEQERRERVLTDVERLLGEHSGTAPAAKPPLFGIPIGVKDLFATDGFDTRAGSRLPARLFSGPEAPAVTRLKRAGAIIVGKTVTTEFAYFAPGPTRNPWNTDHTPGGSSSGSAAAVAAGMARVALGTQTIGSVNRPAAFCGIVGYKPSYGLAPTNGVVPFSHSSDHVGLLATDVATATVAAAVLCGSPFASAGGVSRAGTRPRSAAGRFIRCTGPYEAQADAVAREAVDRVIHAIRGDPGHAADAGRISGDGDRGKKAGRATDAPVEQVDLLPDIKEINKSHGLLIAREFAEVHESWSAEYGELYSSRSRELVEKGRSVDAAAYEKALRLGEALRKRLHDSLGEGDIILTPGAPGTAPEGIEATGSPVINLPWTYAGLPTVTLPVFVAANGLPVAVQLVGRFGEDASLLRTAAWIESRLGFRP